MKKSSSMFYLTYLMILCSGMGGMLYGYDIGVISGALHFIEQSIPMNTHQIGLVVGAVLTGSLFGTLITGPISDRFGRRKAIIFACLIFMIGLFWILSATCFFDLLSARLFLGTAVGMVSVAVPLYLTETAPAHARGRSLTLFQLFITFGIVLAYFVDYYYQKTGNWKAMFEIIFIPASALFISMLVLPESPRWLIRQGFLEKANRVMRYMMPEENISSEIACIKNHLNENSTWRELFSMRYALPLFLGLTVAICSQLSGINAIFQYAPYIFKMAGFSSDATRMMATIGLGSVNFLATVFAMLCIDSLGRRKLLIFGTAGMFIANSLLTWATLYLDNSPSLALFSLSALLLYIFSFAVGPGVVVWLAVSELFPTGIRAKGIALCLFVNSLSASLLTSSYLDLIGFFGISNVYGFFATTSLIYFLVTYYFLPETRGKTLETIQDELIKHQNHSVFVTSDLSEP